MTAWIAAAAEAPAAGSPLAQVAIATTFATIVTVALLALVGGHRSGRSTLLARGGVAAGRLLHLQPWAALPMAIGGIGLAAGGFGVFWDISLHIDVGRDEGPLANPAHYFILFALYSCFAAGVVAIALHENADKPAPRALRLPGGRSAPVGGALLVLCGAFALSGFPLDDVWHRMFGQDVTLWGPTHLIMINGAIFSLPALLVLALESRLASGGSLADPPRLLVEKLLGAAGPGALLFAIAFWATEFDWGIPQYRLVWQPLLLALAAALALTAGRLWLGRGGALQVVVFYLVGRGVIELAVHLLGQTAPAMPLFLVEALIVEAVAWRAGKAGAKASPAAGSLLARIPSPLRIGLVAGLLVGTVGFAAEYAWSHAVMPYPWSPALLGEGLPTAILAGLAGGTLGALLGAGLRGQLPVRRTRRIAALGAAATLVLLGANALWISEPEGIRAQVELTPVASSDGREAIVSARFEPADAVRDPEWLAALSWQGGGIVVRNLREVGDGLWRTDGPVPLHGDWKAGLRLQQGRTLVALPLYLPREPEIPTPGVTRPERFTATFGSDVSVMQTERRDYAPGWLWTPAALLMLLACGLFIAALALGIARVTAPEEPRSARPSRPSRTGGAAAATPAS